MAIRVTVMINSNLDRKIRMIQAKRIKRTGNGCSFSKIVNETLREGLK